MTPIFALSNFVWPQ